MPIISEFPLQDAAEIMSSQDSMASLTSLSTTASFQGNQMRRGTKSSSKKLFKGGIADDGNVSSPGLITLLEVGQELDLHMPPPPMSPRTPHGAEMLRFGKYQR